MRNPVFDGFFILGIPLIAAISVALVFFRPALFEAVIFLDLALLGYHHVIATFTRMSFTPDKARENRALLLYTPVLVLGLVAFLALNWGVIVITTIYLHWQWWHYTRQSEGIAKAYGMKTRGALGGNQLFNRFAFYMVPVATFLSMSSRNPDTFLFSSVYTLPIPSSLANITLIVAALVFSFWLAVQVRALLFGTLAPLLFIYYLSHFGIYFFAYHMISDITVGWLLINIWHNLQYITFVWICNVNQFGSGGSVRVSKFRAWFCKPGNWFFYFAACYFVTDLAYDGVDKFIGWLGMVIGASLPLSVICYQTINFHHYIVDTCIWKLRKESTRSAVGVSD